MRLIPRKKAGFLTRLGNIIIIQVLFVFAALAILIFYPEDRRAVDSEYVFMRQKLQQAGQQITAYIADSTSSNGLIANEASLVDFLGRVLDIDDVVQSYVYVRNEAKGHQKLFTLRPPVQLDEFYGPEFDFESMVDRNIVEHHVDLDERLLIPIIHNSRYFVYYYGFEPRGFSPMVIVAISDHNPEATGFAHVRYPFLILFLVSALVSLLTVYLINKRFQQPLERLINGFDRTVKGELYSLVETDMDPELSELAKAYNDMSLTLWDNHKKLSDYNTRLEEANEMLSESQEFLGTLVDSSPICIISASCDGEIMVFNRKAAEVFGVEPRAMIGRNIDDLFTHSLSEIKTSKAIVVDNHSLEMLCRRQDGTLFPAYVSSAPVQTGDGEIWAHLYLVKDISESKKFQEMMVRLDRYYTKGEMVGDIAHEINNFLAILSGNIELMPLLMKKGDPEKINRKLEVMKGAIDRIVRFTDGLMDSDQDDVRFEITDINQLVQTVIAFLKPQNRFDNIQIKTELSTDIPLMEIDNGQLQQLLVNLLYNASDALSTREADRLITISTKLTADSQPRRVLLEVRDNGPGVAAEKRDLLFVKRFTTKARGHGIGLITCRKIADTHDAEINYSFDSGAVFVVSLPDVKRIKPVQETAATEESAASPV